MHPLAVALTVLALMGAAPGLANGPRRPARLHFGVCAGGYDELGGGLMPRRDGQPGNVVLGWSGSSQVGAGLGFELFPGLTIDLGYQRLDFDLGSDLVYTPSEGEFVSTGLATGELDELRFAVWLDAHLLTDDRSYYVSADRTSRGRFAIGAMAAFSEPRGLEISDSGRELLGIVGVEGGPSTSLGFGARLDYRFGRSRFTVGADLDWMWNVSGDAITITTSPESAYLGTSSDHEGLSFLVDFAYHF